MPANRPCLKANMQISVAVADPLPFAYCNPKVLLSPHVHFPPTPTLVSTHTTHSSGIYDRAPITIAPNSCALPERGGRMYTPAADTGRNSISAAVKGSYFHPKAYEACQPEPSGVSSLPHLIPDLSSSESDESDGPVVTPPEPGCAMASIRFSNQPLSPLSRHSPIPRANSREKLDNALSFLPHPPPPGREKSRSPSRPRLARRSTKFAEGFSQSTTDDGCLGGF